MTTNMAPPMTFDQYLAYDDGTDNRYEWIAGALVEMPTESELNAWISLALQLYLIQAGLVRPRLTQRYSCELEVPVLRPKQARNRFPDLVVLQPEHLDLTQQRLTIRLDMPPPTLVVEVVSPGRANRERDYDEKRAQYQARGIPEYWLVDPDRRLVTVLSLGAGDYEAAVFSGADLILSPTFPSFALTANEVLNPAE